MKLSSILLLVSSIAAIASTEEQINKRFSVQPGGTVTVEVAFGTINVSSGSDQEVVVDAWRKIGRRNKAEEEAYLRENPIEFSQDGANVTIRCRDKAARRSWSTSGRGHRNEGKYTITVPAKFNAQLKTSGGDISVKELTGDTHANTSGGGLHFEHLRGPLEGVTSGGDIRVRDTEGKIRIHTSGGAIDVTKGSGSLEAGTSGGSIKVKDFSGATTVETTGGSLSLENHTGELHGSTTGGSIQAALAAPLGETTKLSTTGGDITIRVPQDAAFDLDAATTGGSVHSEFPIAGADRHSQSHLKGAVNGGGKSLFLRSTGGNIRVDKL